MTPMDALWKEPQFALEWSSASGPLRRQYYQDPSLKLGKLPARMPRSACADLLLDSGYTADQANGTTSGACDILGVTRREGQSILIGDDVKVTVVSTKGAQVRFGITAPKHVGVLRQEVVTRSAQPWVREDIEGS
jgi:carbon storage regulator